MKTTQPKLADLFERYLNRQSEAHQAGLAAFDPTGEVQPYEAGPVQPIDPAPAWREGISVLAYLGDKNTMAALKTPPGWPTLVAANEPVVSLAFCVGNFPQLMRNLHLLLHGDLVKMRPGVRKAIDVPELEAWVEKVAARGTFPELLLAVGSLRLAGKFEAAARLLDQHEDNVPPACRDAWENERAALAWHRGNAEEALASWRKQPDSVPVLFNRGMAALFLGRHTDAAAALTKAVAMLSEESAWHHLGRLYLTLARNQD